MLVDLSFDNSEWIGVIYIEMLKYLSLLDYFVFCMFILWELNLVVSKKFYNV